MHIIRGYGAKYVRDSEALELEIESSVPRLCNPSNLKLLTLDGINGCVEEEGLSSRDCNTESGKNRE